MTWRQLIIGIIIVSALFALIMLGLIGVIYYKPELIGFKAEQADSLNVDELKIEEIIEAPPPVPLKTVYIEPTVEISHTELAYWESQVLLNDELIIRNDSLLRMERFLRDSIKANNNSIAEYRDSIKRAMNNADKAINSKDGLLDSISKINNDLKRAVDRYELAQKRIENYESLLEERVDKSAQENFETFAKIYDNSNSQEVANILELLDERDAAKILKLMNRKKAGKVLESMKPENAAAILLLGIGQ